jgi:hypothetical protein
MSDTIAATNENESAIPTMRISRALISSLVRRFSGFMGSVFLVGRLLWWFRSFRVHGQRNYSGLVPVSASGIVASLVPSIVQPLARSWAYSSSVISRISSSIWINGLLMVS